MKKYERAEADYTAGMKYKDIAEKYSVSINTVKTWKTRYNWKRNKKCANTKKREKEQIKRVRKKRYSKKVAEEVSEILEEKGITDKQRLFCVLYVKCFNATKAYQKAYGCGYETAMVNGCKLLRKDNIRKEIQMLKENRINREFFDEEDLFQKYIDIAFADIKDYLEFGRGEIEIVTKKGEVIKVNDNYVHLKNSRDVDGTIITEVKEGRNGVSVKLADKMKALQWLTDHIGLASERQQEEIKRMKMQTKKMQEEIESIKQKREDAW